MPRPNAERVKSYLQLISRNSDPEKLLNAAVAPAAGGFETAEAPGTGNARTGFELALNNREVSADQAAGMESSVDASAD